MKRIFNLVAAFCAVIALASCEKDPEGTDNGGGNGSGTGHAAPSMTWEGHSDLDAPVALEETMDVRISITAEAGISTFTVGVSSGVLDPYIETLNGGSTEMDLIGGPQTLLSLLSAVQIPTGSDLVGATSVSLDLSTLVPMIILTEGNQDLGTGDLLPNSDHSFTLSLTDSEGQSLRQTLTFHYDGETVEDGATLSVDETSVDLWANTARVTVNDPTEGVQYSVQYREKGTETWHDAAGSVAEGFILAPAYDKSSNEAGLEVSVIRDGAGIYAGNTYEVRLLNSDAEADAVEFTAEGGDVIPNGDMTGWTVKEGTELPYPNPAGTSFWDSGNNTVLTITTVLCQEDETEAGVAALSANTVLGSVFAPGNMYTGDFTMSGFTGTAKFGKSYDWTARPRALKLRYKANVGVIDNAGSNDPEKDEWDGRQDVSRIFVAIVDWSAQHEVTSGMTTPEGMWDPAEVSTLEEGAILGYGDLKITGNVESWTDAELKINWYDTEAPMPLSEKYSLVISCATSQRGDYLTGCSSNAMWVDDFAWAY